MKPRYSAFTGSHLHVPLWGMGIQSLIMTGVSSNNCVEATARDGFMHDYSIVFVDDCTAATDAAIHHATLWNIGYLYGVVAQSESICQIWERSAQAPAAVAPAPEHARR